eukprot:g4295.t1 g4295   contig15:735478-737560(-)
MNDQYNSRSIIAAAEAKLASSGIGAAQNVYQSALLDWVDDATMGDTVDLESVRGEVANLWLAYAGLNRRSNLFKSATEVYEQAINCPVAGEVGKIWLEYAQFLEERGRPRTSQKVYLRALVGEGNTGPAVKNAEDQTLLWNAFLGMMQTLRKNPSLTLEDLKRAVEQEHSTIGEVGGAVTANLTVPDVPTSNATAEEAPRPAKRSRWNKKAPEETETLNPSNIETTAGVLITTSKNMPPEIETLWHARDGGSFPSPPDPPLFTAHPPKLGDPSGKDLIGNETALKLLQMLTAKTQDGKSVGSALLDLCNACWMMAALKEDEVAKAQIADTESLESNLDARASVAGGALAAVQQANEHERAQFNTQCQVQREQLVASSAWEFRKLLYTQQVLLSSAHLPGFTGPTVDSTVIAFQAKVCSVMHSAFYLRARVGETSHVNMLNKQLESLQKIVATQLVGIKMEQVDQQYPTHFQQQPMQYQQPIYQVPQVSIGVTPVFQPPPAFPLPPAMNPHLMQQNQMYQQQFNQQH